MVLLATKMNIATILFVSFVLLAEMVGCISDRDKNISNTQPTAATKPTTQPKKVSLALQAFLVPEQEERIIKCWKAAMKIKGVSCALSSGARPHITFGSWLATPDEVKAAKARFIQLEGLIPGISLSATPSARPQKDGSLFYSFSMTKQPAAGDYHRMVHERVGFTYEPQRSIDLPGQWVPHLSMFTSPADQKSAADQVIEQLSDMKDLRIGRFGLVTFEAGSKTICEIQCSKVESSTRPGQ